MPGSAERQNYGLVIILCVILLSMVYTILRYLIFGNVSWTQFPAFILNKSFSLAGFIALTINFSLGPLQNLGLKIQSGWLNARLVLGLGGFILILTHVFLSFILLNPDNYPKFYLESGLFSFAAGVSLLGGILAFISLWIYNIHFQTFLKEDKSFREFITSRRVMLVSMLFTAIHLLFMGYKGWFLPQTWHGGLPPITLVSFVIFIIGYSINLIGRK